MSIDKNQLSKLSPEERLKRLKQLEEERKKEAIEIEELIKKSMQELKTEKLVEEVTPERRPVDISALFEKGNEGRLAATAKENRRVPTGTGAYQAISQMYRDYSQLKEFHGIVAGGSSLSKEQLAAIGQIGERLNIVEKYMTESEKTASKLDAGRVVLYKLKKETGLD